GRGPGAVQRAPAEARSALEVDPDLQPGRADDRRRPVADDRHRRGEGRAAPGVRGAVPVPALPAAPASRAADLRDLRADPADDDRLLPRPASGSHLLAGPPPAPSGVAARRLRQAADREAARAPAAAPAAPRPDPGQGPRASGPL